MFDEQDRQYFYNEFKNNGYEVGSYDDFKKDLNNKEDRDWYYNEAKNMGYDVGTQADFDKMVLEPAPSTSGGGKQVDASATTQSVGQKASTETKPQVAQPAKKQETTDKEPGLIAKVLDMIPTGVQTSNGTYQPSPEIPQPVVKGEEMPVKEEASSSSANAAPVTTPTGVVNNEGLMDAKLANYIENWKQRPDKQSTYFDNMVADLLADGTANSNEEAVNMVMPALRRYAHRSAMDVTNQVVSSLPDDTVQDAEQSIGAQWYSHGVQDKLKQEADSMGISYDDYVAHFLKPAMVQSLVNKYGPNYRNIAEGIATRLYSHDENVQERLMNQDINDALSNVINKYVSPSVVDEYNKAQKAGSKAFSEGMEGSQFIPANLRLGTALGAQYEANEAKDPAKVLSGLQQKFGKLYRNPKFLNDMSNAALKVMQRYGLNGTQSSDPKQFKPMINAAIKNELDQLEIKGMMPKGSAEYIMKTGLGNTIVGKIIRKAVQTDYQNWLEDIVNQQYQPGFWENVASGALTFAGDAWSYWLPGAAGGKLTKSMVAKAEGRLAGDLMAKGMERRVAERAAKVLIGKSKAAALKSGAAHGAVTFGGQSAISKPIDEVYRTGQFDENGKIYNPSVGKVIANTLGEVAKQSAVGAIMQGGTIANMVGKGRGLATNILADVGGKVVDSGIMTGHQMLERMAQDPNFKPTGKDAAESFLESMANLTAVGLPGMVGKYARFKDAREFNKKFDFTDQDIAELKRFGYDGLRDAFEKMGIGEYAVVGENAQRLDGQLTQKYMDLMSDKSVSEVLKAKMMAVVEGKRPSSFSPVVDSIIVQPMDHDGKVYLETLNKDGGIVDRKEFSSLDEAQKADKKLEYEKTLGLASVLEGEFHNEFTQEHLEGLYNKAAQKYNMGEKLTDEDKAAVYLHQNAGAIKEIMDKQQKGIILTDEEQKQINAYRHYYDSALENSSVMREFVNTFEDSHGVERGTLRKALESKDKKYSPLVESYLKELYNSIELKREMKQTMDDLYNTSHGNEQKRIEGENPVSPVEGSAGGQEPPVSEGPASYQDRTKSVPTPSDAEVAANPANVSNSSAEGASPETKVAGSDAFVMGQNAYKNGDSEALQAIDYNSDLATGRLKRAFADNEKMPDIVANAYNEGRDMEQFVAQRASSLTPAQKEAISKYVEAMDAKKGAIDALQHADDGYGDALKEQLWPYQTVDGNIVPATLDSGKQVFLKKANEYGGAFVVVPDEQGQPTIKQVSNAEIKEVGNPVSLDEYIEKAVSQQKDARNKQFISQFDGSGLKPNDQVTVAMEEGDANIDMTFAGYSEDGKIVLTDGKDYLPLSKEEFAAWRKNALDNTINEHLDAEDDEREQKAVSQAEADKKQRYANGIVGLSEGQPDYSSKDTDAKVAAEYLQEQFGEDHGKLLNLVNGSRDDIETQLANKKKAAAEYQNWLDTNADLDPEKAKKVAAELSLVNEQIADLDARFKNWNTIRNSVMTPDEVKAMKEERKAEIERAGIDKSSVLPDVDTGVRIPENSELKDKYPTQEAASGYITSERRRVYKMQEETQREIDGVDKILNQYMDGDMELSAEQLRDLNTTKAELANRQNALTADAKALKGKAESLNILYIKERAEQNKKNLEALSPKDRRKELVAKALEKKDMKAIKEIYKDASTDVMDLTPRTLEEFVSERLFPHSLNAESLAQELGSFNFKRGIGSKYDTNKFNYLLAKKGEGLTINELAKRVWEDLSSTMESGDGDGLQSMYTDQDVRNAILDMFKTYDSVREMRNVTLLNRIAAAENELSGEEEWYEQQKEREIFEKQKEIDEYKSYIHDKELSLPSESELDHIYGLEYDRMMEIEDREREYKQYVKSILPELADYDDRSNEEGYGGGSSLGSDSSRRGVDEGNSQGEEVGNGEASSESEIGEGSDSGRKGRQETGSMEPGEGSAVRGSHLPQEASFGERLKSAIAETETEPTEAQKKAGNYKKGHLSFGGYDYTVETPKGVTRSGKDEQGKPWSVTMHDTYGYILGKIGVDGDHIDMFINDAADLDTFDGNVYVVDQVNPETGEFDEHKVMYGYPSEEAATEAYLANYSKDWKGLGKVTSVPKATFDKWLESSDRKTKPFADYAMVQKEQAKFDRDVKEVKPSEMTEAQKVAYDAVSTMLKKAGIPVKVVSNEDMEKVAEAQDNLNLAMLLNQPEMRFKIKTPEEKQAAENAYNFAKELRPDKWKQYAVVNMSNPNKMPEYFEKQELARKERSYYNKLMWGNYKVFNLDKSFEDNVAGLTGSFPSEFDPYKIDEQTNKRNELKKQMKETEDAYNSTGQERNKYQIQLMKEYMDEHGLTSENDIPDDVLSDLNDKAHEKYQDKLDSLFAKYKDLDRQLKAVAEPGVRFLRTYHGSGADFTEFDFNHISEGAGSQTFGWGGYVTSSEKIGKSYAKITQQKPTYIYNGKEMSEDDFQEEILPKIGSQNENMFMDFLYNLEKYGVSKAKNILRKGDYGYYKNLLKGTSGDTRTYYEGRVKAAEVLLALHNIRIKKQKTNLYEVDIPEDNGSNYLDWDASIPSSINKDNIIKDILDNIQKQEDEKEDWELESLENDINDSLEWANNGEELYKAISLYLGDKTASKLLASLGYTGIKYKAGRNFGGAEKGDTNYVVFKPEDMKIVDHTKFAQGKGVVYGYTDGKEIVLNQEHLNPNTPIHEYQHLWRTAAKEMNPDLIAHGDELIKQTQLFADLKEDPNYKHLSDDEICDEAFARLTGEDGAAILEQMAKDAIKENPLDTAKELSVINKLKEWLKKFWYWTLDTFTKWKPEDIKKMTLEDIRNLVLRDLANGVDPRNVKSRMTKEDAVSLRKQMADNAEQEQILEHTEENWLKEFGKDSRVTTPIGSIKLGENQYKKAGRNDRIKRFGLLKPTLERPDVILEKSAPKEGAERQTKYLFIKSFKKADGNKILNYESITVKQGEEEVAISAHQIDPSKVLKELTESKVLWNRFRGDSNSLGENQGSALTPSANNPSGKDSVLNPHSDANIRNNIETTKGNGGNLSVEDKIKTVSQQFGVDEADVAMYANAVKKGSTAEAARARANIKRHLLQANEDKISSLKELLKYTKPVNEALKENFGDVDAMIEERQKQVEAQRNAMEAARKRAEEEEAKRQKHLEELSLIPDDQLDKQYMDALAKGDDATAREMLDEAARRKGYDDTESAYQGVGAWAAPGNPGYESDKARRDDWESSGSDVNLEDMALGYTPQPDDYFSHPERYSQNTPHGLESVKAINEAIKAIKNGEKDVKVKVYRAVPTSVKEGKLRNGDWVTPSKKYADIHGNNRLEGKYRIIEDEVPANQLWWDGNDANEFGFDDGKEYKYKNAKNNRKLNDLVTYDDEGDVIPPSKRFNSRKSDVRFMFAGEKGAAEADKADVMPRIGSSTIGLKAAKDKVVELFNKAKSGEFNGKPQSIGTLTQEGKKFLEDLSGLKMKDKIDFVLNPSDLKHMNKDHFGDNEKDPGRNIPLTEEDLRSMVDVIMNPDQVVYGIEKMDNRKAFFFLKQAEDGTLNLAEIYSDKKGNLTAKSYYKTKKGVDQRVMEIKNSLLPTPEASSGSPLSDGKGINFFSIEQEKTAENERKIADSVVNTANKLGGAEATVYSSLDDVPEKYRSEVEQGAKGWYDPETHSVHVYLPNCEDGNDAQRTVFHEKIGHEGMEVLLGGEDGVRKFANFVYRSVGKDVRGKIIDFANKYDPDWKNPDRMNVGTQEYIAHLAEDGPKSAEDFSLWTKIKHYLIKVLKKLGIRVPGLLNDKDLRYYLMKAGKALHVWDNMPKEKQEAMMKQASNAEIKDALSDGAGKGKPRQKKGESTIQYMKRVQEWRKWQNAREDENDPEPPMFYDFDKDAEGKKEWERLNKEWRDSHLLQGDEMPIKPERKEGETDEEFFPRYKEWEKWNDAMADQEDPMPDMFAFEKKKQEEVKRKYEDWLARHELLEQQQADLDLYEGKIYPAETNPKADALEQQVMQDLAEVTSTDVSKEGAAKTVKHAVIHRRKNMEEASADDAIYINDVKNSIEKMADSNTLDKLSSDYKGTQNKAEKLAEAIPYIIEAPRRLRDLAREMNATGVFDKGHIHIQPADVEAIQPFVQDLIVATEKKHTEVKNGKDVEMYDDPQAVSEAASKMAQTINANHQGEEDFVPIDGTDILSDPVLSTVKKRVVPLGVDYRILSPEMKSTIDSIRDWYNYTYDWLKDNHTLKEDAGYNVDYVNHIWDKEKSDEKAYAMYVENRQRTKSPNEKPRTISTLMEGISLGLVPKTTDITKMMAYYSRSNIEAWVNKTMLQELSGLNVIERNEDGEIVSSDPLLSSTVPFNLDQYKDFKIPGVGLVWLYNVSPKQVKVKNPITDKENVIYSEASAGDRFGVVFDTYRSSPFWKGYDKLASILKKLELGFSGFHAGALTEVYMVQNMVEFGPKKAMANFMKYIFVDTMKNHQLPCFANPQDFQEAATHLVKFGATNDYAAADVQNMFDNLRDFAQKLQKKLEERGNIGTAAGAATIPFEIATQMVSMLNKGMDVALWDFLHDGLKLATYRMRADKTKERAKKKGWTEEELSRALDEDGQFVNDMFGGQHWDILGASHRTLRYAGRVLLSPDWNASTTRHFLALTGYGSIWNEATFENFKQYYQRLWNKELIPEDEGRRSRQISALLCYGIGFMVFYEAFANGVNAAFRALDEEKERKKAEEIRKTNPSYKSMYELAYPDGMKWYDYLMRGNSLGQQSKIFLGRYADGTEMYIRHGKQFREIPEYFFNEKGEFETPGPFVNRLVGKANPLIRMVLDDYNYLSPYRASHSDKELQRKYGKLVGNESLGKTIGLLHKNALYAFPFLIPSQENKEFKTVDFFFPSSKGFSPWKAQSYFKDFILSGDMEGVVMTYQSCQRNGIDPEAQIKAAIGSVKALESAEMSDGVTSLQEASKRFDAAKSITEKKKMRQKMKKFLSQSEYKAFTQKEALDMVQGYLNGDEDLKEMEKAESKYLMKAKAEDVTEDWRIQNVWNGTMETYQEYQRLKDVDKAKANAFKNSKTNKRLFAARKAISAARRKMNKAKKQMDGTNDAAKLVEIRKTRKELLKTLNGME